MDSLVKKQKWERIKNKTRRFFPFYIMALPGIAYLIINNYIPMTGITIAFRQYTVRGGLFNSKWIGLKNFEFLFRSSDSWIITRNTILYNFGFIILGTFISVVTAICLNEIKKKFFARFYQTVILLPHLISMVVVSYIAYAFLSSTTGFLNSSVLKTLGIDPIFWYSEQKYWPFILTFVSIWTRFGFSAIIYYASIVGIDTQLFEAAAVDGASRFRQIVSITLPSLKPTIIIMTILAIGRIFYADFGLFYQVPQNSGALFPVTNVIDTYVYRALINQNNIGMSSAANFYQSVIGFVLVITTNSIVRRIDRENALY